MLTSIPPIPWRADQDMVRGSAFEPMVRSGATQGYLTVFSPDIVPPVAATEQIPEDVAGEVIRDLLRSAWVIERSRRALYKTWAQHEPSFTASAERAEERASIVLGTLEARGHKPDPGVVDAHAGWMLHLAGRTPDEVALG